MNMDTISQLLASPETVIIDVRSPEEFMGGHVAGSINIPLHEIPGRIDELKKHDSLVLCCAAGGRSGQATAFLQQHGIKCLNGGAWTNVNYYKNNII